VQVWQATTGEHVLTYGGHASSIRGIAWSPDGTRIASGALEEAVRAWDATTGNEMMTYGYWLGLTVAPDGKRIADMDYGVGPVVWSPDGQHIASPTYLGPVGVWEARTGQNIAGYRGHVGQVHALAWSPDGTRLATGGDDGIVQVWEAP